MKYLKTYEEISPDVYGYLTVGVSVVLDILLIAGFIKYKDRIANAMTTGLVSSVSNYFKNRYFKNALDGSDMSSFKISEKNNIITIDTGWNRSNPIIEIDKNNKTIHFNNFSKKISEQELQSIVKKISEYKVVKESLDDILQEVSDYFYYEFYFSNSDNYLHIKLERSVNDRVSENFDDFILSLEEAIDRVEDEFKVKLKTDADIATKLKLNYFIYKKDEDLMVSDKGNGYIQSLESLGYLPSYLNLVFDKK